MADLDIKGRMTFQRYMSLVLDKLEYIGYPELIVEFEPEQVGRSMAGAMYSGYEHWLSPMMCAITIWSLTMNFQIMPGAKATTKH